MTRDEVRAWFTAELARCKASLGEHWEEHGEWVRQYLIEEGRQKLRSRPQ